jgi:WD40 repeat protein
MKHLMTVVTILLFPFLLLAGCGGNSQPSGPPPLTYATATAGTSTPGGSNAGETLQILRPGGQASVLAWSPDGTRLAVAFSRNTGGEVFQVWDTTTGKQLSTYNGQFSDACCLAWSPDGARIALAGNVYANSDPSHVRIWDTATGSTLFSLVSDSQSVLNGVQALAWLDNGARLVTLLSTGPRGTVSSNPPAKEEVQVFDTANGKLLSTYPTSIATKFDVAAWSPDGKEIAVGNNDGTVQVWDVASGKLLLTYRGHSTAVYALAWSPDGRFLASGSSDTTVQVWDAVTGKAVFTYHGHSNEVHALAWSPDSKRIVSGSGANSNGPEDHPVQVWDAFTGQHVFDYDGQSESIAALAWSPDGSEIASAGSATVQVWQAPPES